jgi:transposase
MPPQAAARVLRIPKSTLSDLLHRTITRIRDGHRIRALKTFGIGEVSYSKGHKYATVVYDLDRARVIRVGPGKGRETIERFFTEQLSDYQKRQITGACCDMSQTYIGAIEQHCPNASFVLDRFHVVKALKGLPWLLFRHSSNRSKKDTRILNALHKGNRRIHRAWVLKDEFEQFWEYKAPWAAARFLKGWTTTALKSRLEPIRKFVKTLRENIHRILPFVETRLTNATAEGLNRIIRMTKNRAS